MTEDKKNFEFSIKICWDESSKRLIGTCPQLGVEISRVDKDRIQLFNDISEIINEINMVSLGIS